MDIIIIIAIVKHHYIIKRITWKLFFTVNLNNNSDLGFNIRKLEIIAL